MTASILADAPLAGRRLFLARAVWLVIVLLTLTLYVLGVPYYWAQLNTPCQMTEQACIEEGILSAEMQEDLQQYGFSGTAWTTFNLMLNLVSAGIWLAVGLVIFLRKSDNGMALFISLFLITFGLGVISSSPLQAASAALPALWLPIQSVMFIGEACVGLFALLFPDGRFVPRWTRWLALIYLALEFPTYFFPGTPLDYESAPEAVNTIIFVGFVILLVGSQVIRYRRYSNPTQRRQTKWVVLGITVGITGFLIPILFATIYPGVERQILVLFLATLAIYGFMTLIPLSFGIAILRSHLWDIDIIIRRTVTYGLLVSILAFVYFASIVVLQQVFASLIGRREDFVTVLSTLAIAALFVPLRSRIQEALDRRFYRKKYDAQRVLQDFAETVRDETDLEKLTARLVEVVNETMQPQSISVWLNELDRKRSQ